VHRKASVLRWHLAGQVLFIEALCK